MTLVLIILALVAFTIFSGWLLVSKPELGPLDGETVGEIGSSLLTGSLVAFAIFLLQIYLEDERNDEAREEQFRLTLGVTKDLEGLDPILPLSGLHLSGKNLDNADLAGEELRGTNLQETTLRGADLAGADLTDANLSGADLTGADLGGADLDGADLRFATIDARIYAPGEEVPTISVEDAQANARTCWPEDFMTSKGLREARKSVRWEETVVNGSTKADAALGHACHMTFDNVVDFLRQFSAHGLRLELLARPWGQPPAAMLDLLQNRPTRRDLDPPPVELASAACTGSTRLRVRRVSWPRGWLIVAVTYPSRELDQGRVFLLPPKHPVAKLPYRLEPRSKLKLLVTKYRREAAPSYFRERKLARC